jgi:hypothetical protein
MVYIRKYSLLSEPITKFTIFGERHSGTNFLEYVVSKNLKVNTTWEFGWKHWIGNNNWSQISNSKDVLFIGIVRNIYDWLGGMLNLPHHLSLPNHNYETLISIPFISDNITDNNYITGSYYKNIFDARYMKNTFLYYYMPYLADNYILIRYEDLVKFNQQICQEIVDTFHINYRRRYRLRKEQSYLCNNKKSYLLPDYILSKINDYAKWEAEYIYGYEKRFATDW